MTLYEIIYDWFISNIWSYGQLETIEFVIGSNNSPLTMDEWLSHSSTIIVLVALVLCCALFVRWIFKVVSGAILLK